MNIFAPGPSDRLPLVSRSIGKASGLVDFASNSAWIKLMLLCIFALGLIDSGGVLRTEGVIIGIPYL